MDRLQNDACYQEILAFLLPEMLAFLLVKVLELSVGLLADTGTGNT